MPENIPHFSVTGSTDDLRKNFGFWFKQQRVKAHKTQSFVAAKTGLHTKHICRIEHGKSGVKRETVISLAKAIAIDENEALKFAGFGINSNDNGIEFEVCTGVLLKFSQEETWSFGDRCKIAEYLRLFIGGLKLEQAEETIG